MSSNSNSGGGDDSSSAGSGGNGNLALKKGPWTAAEDAILMEYVKKHGEGNWNSVQKNSGLSRCGKSCRLRWANHLRPNLKKGSFSPDEERLILELHSKLGNKWARMAAQLPGRTDNEIKNYWNTRIKRRQRAGLPLYPPDIHRQAALQHHNHRHQHRPSPFSSPVSTIPSLQNKTHFSPSLPLLDPMEFSNSTTIPSTLPLLTPTFLPPSSPIHGFKCFSDNSSVGFSGFSLPFSSSPPPPPWPLFNQNLQTQQSIQFNSGNFDLNPSILQPNFNGVSSDPSISMKLELPSSQFTDGQLERSNSGLLDALLQEAEEMGRENEDLGREEGWIGGSLPNGSFINEGSMQQWDNSTTSHSSIDIKAKKEPSGENNSGGDLSNQLDVIPASMPTLPEWYSDSGEMSNALSGVSDDNMVLEMQQLASSFIASNDQDWSLGTCAWNNMPGIC